MMLTVRRSRFFRLWLAVLLLVSLSFSAFQIRSASATVNSDYESYVMGPLYNITDWSGFQNQLVTLKNNGVTAITTDVWWGYFERKSIELGEGRKRSLKYRNFYHQKRGFEVSVTWLIQFPKS